MSGAREKSLIVWASGMIQFVDGNSEPDGAIRICTATGEDAIKFLFETVKDAAELHEFAVSTVALKVPGIDPDGNHALGQDPIDILINFDAELWNQIGADADFDWKRPRELVA